MRKYPILFFISLFPILLFAQKTKLKKAYHYKSDQLKESYFVLKKNKNLKHGLYQSYHKNGKLKEYGFYENNRKIGEWKLFYESEEPKEIGCYENNLKIGEWKTFNLNGNPKILRTYKKGKKRSEKKVGIWETTYERGQVIKRFDYDNGVELKPFIRIPIDYPAEAREKNIQGTVEIELTLNKNCVVQKLEVVKSVGYGCDEAAFKSIQKLAELIAQYDKTECTGIKRTIPVHFKLQ